MSADNGLIVKFEDGSWSVGEFSASESDSKARELFVADNIEEATRWAQNYQENHVVEYGISFNFGRDAEGEIQVVMLPSFRERFEEWLESQGFYLFRIPIAMCENPDCDDLPSYGIGIAAHAIELVPKKSRRS